MNIDRLVNLTITIADRITQGVDLGTPLLMGYHTHSLPRVQEFATAAEMLDAGFATTDYLYQQAVTLKSQENALPTFKVGRRATALTQTIRFTPTVTTVGYVYKGTIGGAPWTYTVPSGADLAAICTGIAGIIDALSPVAATATTTYVTVTATTPGAWVAMDPGEGIDVLDVTPDTTTDDEIAAVIAEDDEWYGYLQECSSPASIALVAAAIEPLRKIAIVQSPDSDILSGVATTDVASVLHDANYTRTFGIWHKKIGGTESLATAWMAGRLTAPPGSETWAFKTLVGPSVDKVSTGAESALLAKNWNFYSRVGSSKTGISMTFDGKAGGGRYGDVVRVVDKVYTDIQLAFVAALANNPKIPYDDDGISLSKGLVFSALRSMETAGGFRKGLSTVSAPKVADIPAEVRATRIVPDIDWAAELAGALHGVKIRGRVTS